MTGAGWGVVAVLGGAALGFAISWPKLKRALDNNKRFREEQAAGNMIKRDTAIWEEERRYTTAVSYERLLSALQDQSYANCRAEFHPNYNGNKAILFRGEGWNAMLVCRSEGNGTSLFSFYYPAYRDPVSDVLGDMNILLTTVEKTLLSLDGNTTLTIHKLAYKTQSR